MRRNYCIFKQYYLKYYLAMNVNKVLIHVTTQVKLENIRPNERNNSLNPHIIWFHVYEMFIIDKFGEQESRSLVAQRLGYMITQWLQQYWSSGGDKNVLHLGYGMGVHCKWTKILIIQFKQANFILHEFNPNKVVWKVYFWWLTKLKQKISYISASVIIFHHM